MNQRQLLEAIRARTQKKSQFGHGILTADLYLKGMLEGLGSDLCYQFASRGLTSFDDLMRKAARTLVYSNPEMKVEEKLTDAYSSLPRGTKLPKNTLMVFKHTLTSSAKDRDGDTLHSDGASVDPNMLMIWQHVHTMPIGKFIAIAEQNTKHLKTYSAIVDINDLSHDSAVMVDNGMGRFSHGFRALEFVETKGGREGGVGFDIHKFEIMEESLVSVPANPDAQTDEVIVSLVERGKLTSPLMKEFSKSIRERMPLSVPVKLDLKVTVNGQEVKDENKSRNGEGAGEKGKGTTSTPAKANGDNEDEEEGADKKVECPECGEMVKPDEDGECPECGASMKEEKKGKKNISPSSIHAGMLSDSWESIESQLRDSVKHYLISMGHVIGDTDWVWLMGTYNDFAIVCCEKGGNREFYKIAWQLKDGKPQFVGEPNLVEVKISTELIERAKRFRPEHGKPYPNEHAARMNDPDKYGKIRRQNDKFGEGIHAIFGVLEDGKTEVQAIRFDSSKFSEEEAREWLEEHKYKPAKFEPAKEEKKSVKQGRVISHSNEAKIKDAKEDVDEASKMDIARPAKALLKSASRSLTEVIDTIGNEGPVGEKAMTVEDAMAKVLAEANTKQRKNMADALRAIDMVEKETIRCQAKRRLILRMNTSRRS